MNKIKKTYLENEKTLKRITRCYWYKNKDIDYADLLSEAHLTFLYCYDKIEKNNSYFEKYLVGALHKNLLKYVTREAKKIMYVNNEELLLQKAQYIENDFCFDEWKNKLSDNSRKIVDIIFLDPIQKIKSDKTNKITCASLKKYLRTLGWKFTTINFSFDEIKKNLNYC